MLSIIHRCLLLVACGLIALQSAKAQTVKRWDRIIGGNKTDVLSDLALTADGGYILGGTSTSDAKGDKRQANKGEADFWVVKLDEKGRVQWEQTVGGSGSDELRSITQTQDGGYLLAGNSASPVSGDKSSAGAGGQDYWLVKLNSRGHKQWDWTFGGQGWDYLISAQQTADGGYFLAGYSSSPVSGQKTQGNRGSGASMDFWVLKLNTKGQVLWDRTLGGKQNEWLANALVLPDGSYVLGGTSTSGVSGDKTYPLYGGKDYWLVKLDSIGNQEWDRTWGGPADDWLSRVQRTADGGYVLGGTSNSGSGGTKSAIGSGGTDYWLVKIDATGIRQWDTTIGTALNEELRQLQQTTDGGYVVGGSATLATIPTDKKLGVGNADFWIVKLDARGSQQWNQPFGGPHDDWLTDLVQLPDGGLIIGGCSASNSSGNKSQNNNGKLDYWILRSDMVDMRIAPE